MNTTTSPTAAAEVGLLSRSWVLAELAADVDALDRLAAAGFAVVGPVGFVLDKQQWLDRYRNATFATSELAYSEVEVRLFGDAAVSIGVHTQRASYQGNPADGRFRSTHIAVRGPDGWRLAGMHLSPIGGPPPFAPRPETGQAGQS